MPMTKMFTENELIKHVYGELETREKEMLEVALLKDETLQDQLFELQLMKTELDHFEIAHSSSLTEKIMMKVSVMKEVSI